MIRGVVGTAGHIDHGKTALVAALTGVDTDRLPEEKRRGITIDLGFTHLDLDGASLGLVDVPGHEDFIRNMVAGAAGIDLLLLVVAADEGVMPQTREHLDIARLLHIPTAVVALSKADLVDDDFLALARDDVAATLDGSPFANAPIIPASAVTGLGIEEIKAAIRDGIGGGRGNDDDLFRMPIDRAFTVRGTGTVVTGTVWSGSVAPDDQVRLLPGDSVARVRAVQVHGAAADRARSGQRAAIALAGLNRADAPRGTTLVTDAAWRPSDRLGARVTVLPGTDWSIEHGQRVRVHLGTAEVMARVHLPDRPPLGPGDEGWAELRLERPLLARARDRFVLRSYSPVTTIAGGVVVEPWPPKRSRRARQAAAPLLESLLAAAPEAAIAALFEHAGMAGVERATLPHVTGAAPDEVAAALDQLDAIAAADRVHHAAAADELAGALASAVDQYHAAWPLRPGIDAGELRRAAPQGAHEALTGQVLTTLLDAGTLVMREGKVARPAHRPSLSPDQEAARDAVLRAYADAGPRPPRTAELREAMGGAAPDLDDLLALLEAAGHLVRLEHDLLIHGPVIASIADAVRSSFAGRGDLTPAEVRDLLGVSRRHLIPILEHLDREGVTRRAGAGRAVIPG